MEASNCQLLGHCPVTLLQSLARGYVTCAARIRCLTHVFACRRQCQVVAGNANCAVSYQGKVYRLASEKELNEFMR